MANRSVRELINSTKTYASTAQEALEAAYEAYKSITLDISYANEKLAQKKTSKYPEVYAKSYAETMKQAGIFSGILQELIDQAIEVNDEFSSSYYREALYEVARNLEIYHVTLVGAGWNTRLSINIIFEEVAGTLMDWARGVIEWRDALGIDSEEPITPKQAERATRFWFSKVYKKPLEVDTFQGRIDYAGRPAPFWQILNSGSPAGLPSDRGGYNPVISQPTDFIGDAELALSRHFKAALSTEKDRWLQDIKLLEAEISRASELLEEVSDLIIKLKADDRLDRAILAELNNRSKSGDISQYVSRDKLREAVRKYKAGEEFSSGRVELTARNEAGRRIRPRKSTFIRIVEGYEEL